MLTAKHLAPALVALSFVTAGSAQNCVRKLACTQRLSGVGRLFPCWGTKILLGARDFSSGKGQELYVIDVKTRTCSLYDIMPGSMGSNVGGRFVCCGDRVYFTAQGPQGRELYEFDGTNVKLHDLRPGTSGSSAYFVACFNNKYYFGANDGRLGFELWCADPGSGTVRVVKDINPGTASGSPGLGVVCKDKLYFPADDGRTGSELWVTDGTTAGTRLVHDLNRGAGSSRINSMACVPDASGNMRVFFTAEFTSAQGPELYVFDGSQVRLVKDIRRTGSAVTSNLTRGGTKLFFSASDGSTGIEPWVSDGTAAGTFRLADISPGAESSGARDFLWCNGKMFFNAHTGRQGINPGLYVTDGTRAGTRRVANNPLSGVAEKVCGGDRLYFGVSGSELWSSDGTPAGTRRVCQNGGSRTTISGGDVFFASASQIWVVEHPGAIAETIGEGCSGATLSASAAPRIGAAFRLQGECAPGAHVGVTFLQTRPRSGPLFIPGVMAPGCWGWFGLISADYTSLAKSWQTGPIGIPNLAPLLGVHLFYQTFYVNLTSVVPLVSSNGLLLTLGR